MLNRTLISVKYFGSITRRSSFGKLNNRDVDYFRSILDPPGVLTDNLEFYNSDWTGSLKGKGTLVLRPHNTDQVSGILRHCSLRKLAVVPQGGNTGLVGGSVPIFDEIILSTERMNKIESLDSISSIVTVQSGVVLEKLDSYLGEYGLMTPLDLGAKGSCQLGGNLSTNAGGLRLLRYGNLRGNVLGVEAVLPSGEIIDCLTTMKKDNTGYGIHNLFIGSEGTLGVITRLSLVCVPRPKSKQLAILAYESFENVLQVYKKANEELGEILSSFEFIDSESMKVVTENLNLDCPIGNNHPFYILIEISGSNFEHDAEKFEKFLFSQSSNSIKGTIASSSVQIKALWALRERITEGLRKDGFVYKYDISLPLTFFYQIVVKIRNRLGDKAKRVAGYGHIGDGNLHLNITSTRFEESVLNSIEPYLFEWTKSKGGSISAEHGIGFNKRNYMHLAKSASSLKLMRNIKNIMDPDGILNPYKVFPDDYKQL